MGIPINGDIYSFSKKLEQKGFLKGEDEMNGGSSFDGRFFGEEAYVDVHFDPETKIVYEVSVSIIKKYSWELIKIQKDIMETIEEKYTCEKEIKNVQLNQFDYYLYERYNPIGMIQTFILDLRSESMLSISYLDVENYLNIENKKRNDV